MPLKHKAGARSRQVTLYALAGLMMNKLCAYDYFMRMYMHYI